MALALPDAVAGEHQGHPDFRVAGRVFASLHPDGGQAMVRLSPGAQQQVLRAHPGAFFAANGAWGRAGCTMARLTDLDEAVLRDALTEAWQFATAMGARRRARK